MNEIELTEEEKAAGAKLVKVPLEDIVVADVSDKKIEEMARGFILGNEAIGKRRSIKEALEEKVTKRIGRKGKYLVDKLFELIDGVYIIQKENDKVMSYYKVPPNLTAIIYALDRVLGKPKQYEEPSEEKKGIMIVESIIRNLAGGGTVEQRKSVEIKS